MFLSVPKPLRETESRACTGAQDEWEKGGEEGVAPAHKGQTLASETMKGSLHLCKDRLKFCGAKTWPEWRPARSPCGAGISEPSLSNLLEPRPSPPSAPEAGGSALHTRLGCSMLVCLLFTFQSKVEAIWQLRGCFLGLWPSLVWQCVLLGGG